MTMRGKLHAVDVYDEFVANRDSLLDRKWLSEWLKPHCKLNRLGWRGDRLRIIQYPTEFADFLILLATKKVTSYLEIGTSTGGSFLTVDSYLRAAVPGYIRSDGYDRKDKMRDYWEEYKVRFPTCSFSVCDSRNLSLGGTRYSAAFIDARHLEPFVMQDYERVKPHCRLIGFHDIVLVGSTVGLAWNRIKSAHRENWEFITDEIPPAARCGIGVVAT